MSEFTGRRVVVMGGSKGIGRSTALLFARAGAAVAICARGAEALDATKREIEAAGVACYAAQADLGDPAAIERFVPQAAEALGGINVLVNNASGFGRGDDEASWAASVSVDLLAIIRATAAAMPFLEHASDGAVVNVSSTAGLTGYAGIAAYVAAKWGLRGLTKAAALELAADRIRVCSVHPGPIRTPMTAGMGDESVAGQPIERFGDPDEVAAMVVFIAAGATFSTGSDFVVDGGARAKNFAYAPAAPADLAGPLPLIPLDVTGELDREEA